MVHRSSFDLEEFDEGPRRFEHEEAAPPRFRSRRDEEEYVKPLELGEDSGSRFGKLSDRDQSGSW